MTGRSRRRGQCANATEKELEGNESSGPEPQSTSSGSQNKRKRGQCGRNKYPEGQWTVNVVSPAGEPIEPLDVCAKFRNAIGSIIRKKMVLNPTIPDWLIVPEGRKEAMWNFYFAKRNSR